MAREVARRSFVLVRNEPVGVARRALPIDAAAVRRVAVIGAAARDARVLGGGSATVFPERVVSPLAGLCAALPDDVEVTFAAGADPRTRVPHARAASRCASATSPPTVNSSSRSPGPTAGCW